MGAENKTELLENQSRRWDYRNGKYKTCAVDAVIKLFETIKIVYKLIK